MPESFPGQTSSFGSADPDRVREDVAALADLVADGIDVDGQVVRIAESTWAIYGHATYEGEIIVGEYPDAEEAAAVLNAAPRRAPGPDRSLSPSGGHGSWRGSPSASARSGRETRR